MSEKTSYIKSAVFPKDYPNPIKPEVAVAGRSNAGKSSFINTLTGFNIAKVSAQPGKTRLLNFFEVGENYRMVDMPGYGFAARSAEEINEWKNMIETYLAVRENLAGLILIMDSRRIWSKEEEQLKQYLNSLEKPMMVVLTKSDKLNQSEQIKSLQTIKKSSQLSDVFIVSNTKNRGVSEVENYYFKKWIKPILELRKRVHQ